MIHMSLQCITDVHRSQGINSSRDLPDNILTFARRHPLMAKQVHPIGVRPLMFKRSVNYVKIAVYKETALDRKTYTVLFLGTGEQRSTNHVERHKPTMMIPLTPDIYRSYFHHYSERGRCSF